MSAAKWVCAECGEQFTFWARAERHSDEQGHHRINLVLVDR